MDFTKFLNSKDIAEHLRKIKYEFSPEEALYVIHGSRNRTLAEKREAYLSLLAQYPEYKLKERGFGAFKNHTLESFLHTYFKKQDALIADCKRSGDDAVYSFCTYNSAEGWGRSDRSLFRIFDECFSAAKEEDGVEKIEITKRFLSPERRISVTLLKDGTMLDVETSERDDEVLNAFEMLYVEIPTPFRFGDIVTSVKAKVWDSKFHEPHWDRETASGCDLRETWGSAEGYFASEKLRKRHLVAGDETDMLYAGYFLTEHEFVRDHSVGDTYLDLEYFRGKLSGRGRILQAISLYFRREINLETLFASVKAIEAEEIKHAFWESSLQGYEEAMKQIGIKEGELCMTDPCAVDTYHLLTTTK